MTVEELDPEAGNETVPRPAGELTVRLRPAVQSGLSTQVIRVPEQPTQVIHSPEQTTQIIRVPEQVTQVIRPPEPPLEVIRIPGPPTETPAPPAEAVEPEEAEPEKPGPEELEPEVAPEPPTHTVVLPRVSTDPLDELVDRIRPTLVRAVDALQVAAALEADGFTDRIARVEYGFSDVFALAAEVFHRLGPPVDAAGAPAASRHTRRDTLRLLAHGPLYALPAAVFPAVLGLLGRQSVVLTLVVASGVGWMAAGTVAYGAYRLLGAARPGAAARLLRLAALLAPPVGAATGLAVLATAGGGGGLIVLAAGQLAYQMAATVLMFYRREGAQAAVMAPAVLAGGTYLVTGGALRPAALVTAAAGVTACYLLALYATRGHGTGVESSIRPPASGLAGVTFYGLCSAVLLVHAEAPYLSNRLDVAVAAAPLIAAMGFVEWRAERFRAEAAGLTRRSHAPEIFGRRMWGLVGRETVACLAVPAFLGLLLLAALDGAGRLSAPAALMTAAHVVLGGAYYSAFLLAGFERFGRLCAAMLLALAAHIGIGAWLGVAPLLGRTGAPLTDTALYLGSTLGLLGLFLLGLAPILGQVRHYR